MSCPVGYLAPLDLNVECNTCSPHTSSLLVRLLHPFNRLSGESQVSPYSTQLALLPVTITSDALSCPHPIPLPPSTFWVNTSAGSVLSMDDAVMFVKFLALRVVAALAGLVGLTELRGNLAVLWVLGNGAQALFPLSDTLVFNLALEDLKLALLPFWAAESALDFHWPFGGTLCKMVLQATVFNICASIFFIVALSAAGYSVVVMAARTGTPPPSLTFITTLVVWVAAVLTLFTIVFGAKAEVWGMHLCMLCFPSRYWLEACQLRVKEAFMVPLGIITTSYLLLLAFLQRQQPRLDSRVMACSICILVASFFSCWFPNHMVTLWGVLVQYDLVPDSTFYTTHTYFFSITTHLAHSNSCFNPVLYCLLWWGGALVGLSTHSGIFKHGCGPRAGAG
ncbi:LOW QUALITY PROTEIN: relaxin-3 receptor 2 [Rhynchonycteris naso]